MTPLAPKAKPPAPVVVVVKAPPPVKPVVPAVAAAPYDNTPKTVPWWTLADGVTARQKESKPAWWSKPQVVAAAAVAAAAAAVAARNAKADAKAAAAAAKAKADAAKEKNDTPGKAAWCDPKRPAVAQALREAELREEKGPILSIHLLLATAG
jgi:hypothetical protein